MTLVCFAVNDEARPFRPWARHCPDLALLVTGMGAANAERACARRLAEHPMPAALLTCGFAGGLDPRWDLGTVLYDADAAFPDPERLTRAGARPGRFHQTASILATAIQKRSCWQTTGCDAVEMESSTLRTLSRRHAIPSATVRVVSDAAGRDLPVDFNRFLTSRLTLDFPRLLGFLATHPARLPDLLRFQRETALAARELASVLRNLWSPKRPREKPLP